MHVHFVREVLWSSAGLFYSILVINGPLICCTISFNKGGWKTPSDHPAVTGYMTLQAKEEVMDTILHMPCPLKEWDPNIHRLNIQLAMGLNLTFTYL